MGRHLTRNRLIRCIASAASMLILACVAIFGAARHFVSGARERKFSIQYEAAGLGDSKTHLAAEAVRILHGARSLPPLVAAEALRPFLEKMTENGAGDKLAQASTSAITELVRSLQANHVASDDLWLGAIEATLSYSNETGGSSVGALMAGKRTGFFRLELPPSLKETEPNAAYWSG